MVKHIVVWRVKDTPPGKQANALRVKQLLEGMRGKIPGLLHIECGINFLDNPAASDVVLYSEFPNRAALADYATHPDHEAVKPLIGELTLDRRVVDYDC